MSYIKQTLPADYGFTPTQELVTQDEFHKQAKQRGWYGGELDKYREEFLKRINEFHIYGISLQINSMDAWADADRKIVEGQHLKAGIEERVNPVVSERHQAHKDATTLRKSLIDPIEIGSQALLKEMKKFKQKFEAEQEEEKKRIEGEAKRRQEDACLKQAEEMEKSGAPQEVIDAVLDLADDPAREVHYATPILRSKTSFTPAWKVEVVDESEVPEEYIIRTVNVAAIKKIVNSKKGNIRIPGIKIVEVEATKRHK